MDAFTVMRNADEAVRSARSIRIRMYHEGATREAMDAQDAEIARLNAKHADAIGAFMAAEKQ